MQGETGEVDEDQHEENDSDVNTNEENVLVIENEADIFQPRDEEKSNARGEPLSLSLIHI